MAENHFKGKHQHTVDEKETKTIKCNKIKFELDCAIRFVLSVRVCGNESK